MHRKSQLEARKYKVSKYVRNNYIDVTVEKKNHKLYIVCLKFFYIYRGREHNIGDRTFVDPNTFY